MSLINAWGNLMNNVRMSGGKGSIAQNPITHALAGFGVGGALENWVNPITAMSERNPMLSLVKGEGNMAGSYKPEGGAEESLNNIMATLGAMYGGYAAAGAIGGGAAAGAGSTPAATGAGMGGMGGLTAAEAGYTGGTAGLTLSEAGYAGAGAGSVGFGAEAGAVGVESSGVGGTTGSTSMSAGSMFKTAGRALRIINQVNKLRQGR